MFRLPHNSNHIYFVTTLTHDRLPIFQDPKTCQIFIDVLRDYQARYGFELFGYVILQDHVHMIVRPHGQTIAKIIHSIKGGFAHTYRFNWSQGVKESSDLDVVEPLWFHLKPSCLQYNTPTHKALSSTGGTIKVPPQNQRKRVRLSPIWQKSFHDHVIRDQQDFDAHCNYMYWNPVKHGLISDPDDYRWLHFK